MTEITQEARDTLFDLGKEYEEASRIAFMAYNQGLHVLHKIALEKRDEALEILKNADKRYRELQEQNGDL